MAGCGELDGCPGDLTLGVRAQARWVTHHGRLVSRGREAADGPATQSEPIRTHHLQPQCFFGNIGFFPQSDDHSRKEAN